MTWTQGDMSDLDWIEANAANRDSLGYDVGGLPEAVWVRHPVYTRSDLLPPDESDLDSWTAGPLPEPYRRVTWREYARSRGLPDARPDRFPGFPGILDDDSVISPSEGDLRDPAVWDAIFAALTAHSPRAADTVCTAYYPHWLADPFEPWRPSKLQNVLRGRLGDHRELFARERILTPQNIWPDDHAWVLLTHVDSWATKISGTSELIADLCRSTLLDSVRIDDLP